MTDPLPRLKAALAERYRLEREVGAGGMATVYLAEDLKHRRRVAVKVLRQELAAALGPERFLREIEIAAQLQHPHILPLLDSGEADGFLYYVMPYVEGVSLRDRLTREGELPIADAIRLLRDVADALSYAQSRGVVHRDIKPENVMLSGRHALVTDFGVAKAVSDATDGSAAITGMTTTGMALGTPAYMSPEQAAADPLVDHRSDIYALGAMGYELLTGRTPFVANTAQQLLAAHVTQDPDPISRHRPAVPPHLEQVILRCLAKRPADRWQRADDVVAQLEALGTPSGGITPTSTRPTPAVRIDDRWYGHPFRVGGLFLLASLAVLGVTYFLTIQLGLPDWVPIGAAVLLVLGLPIMLATGLIERRRATLRATGAYSPGAETTLHGLFTWKRSLSGGAAVFIVLALGTGGYTALRQAGIGPFGTLVGAGKLSAKDRLVVADFENRTSDSTLGTSLTEAFRIDLAQSPVVSILGASAVQAGLQRMNRPADQPLDLATARELAARENAKAVVAGDISPVGRGFVLTARVLSTADGAELVAVRETADDDTGLLSALDRLSGRVRERIGESLRTIRGSEPLEQVTTSSLEGLRLYSEGARASNMGEPDRAVTLLRQAIALDSSFAMAWRKLAVAYGNAGVSYSDQADAATRAFQFRERLPELERRLTEAYYYWSVDYNTDKVIDAYRRVLDIDPDEPTALNNLGIAYNERRRYVEAEQLVRRTLAREASPNSYQVLLQSLLARDKVAEARAALDEFSQRAPENVWVPVLRAAVQARTGAYDSAASGLRRVVAGNPPMGLRTGVLEFEVAMEQTRGRLGAAAEARRQLQAAEEQRGGLGGYLASAAREARTDVLIRNDPTRALQVLERALVQHPLASLDTLDRPYAELASAYALAGQPETARRLLREYETTVPPMLRSSDAVLPAAQAHLALAERRPADAIPALRRFVEMTGCTNCGEGEVGDAFNMMGERDSAMAAYERVVNNPRGLRAILSDAEQLARSLQRLGELYEEKGDKQRALDNYARFVDLWRGADTELQPRVREVKQRMAKLAGEPE